MNKILIALFFYVPLLISPQEVLFSATNPSLKMVIYEIESQTDLKFAYGNEIDIVRKLDGKYDFKKDDIKKVIKELSNKTPYTFTIVRNNLTITPDSSPIVRPKKKINPEQPFQMQVEGNVTDENGMPLPSVTVQERGTNNGVLTDFDGNYNIEVSSAESVLVFSYIGMITTERTVEENTTIDVQMEEDSQALDEVILVGYGTQRRSDITGAIGMVDSEEFEDEPVTQIGEALQGKISGLQVTANSGAPGSGLMVRVRGVGTLNNADPLYVVDGNPNVDPIDLVPDQVKSIQVLKSASAAAIYGAQGANGVILITTKQGKAGKSTLNINYSSGLQEIQRYVPMANATQYAILYNEGLAAAGEDPLYSDPESLGEGTFWQKEITQVAPLTNIMVSASGGSETSRYFFSAGYQDQDGVIKGSSFNRSSLRINSSHDITPVLRVGQNLSANISNRENPIGLASALTANPEIPAKFPDGSWGYSPTSLNSQNPAASIYYNHNDTKRSVVNGNVYTDITILKDFEFRSQYNFNIGFVENIDFNPAYEISPQSFNINASLQENFNKFKETSWANTLNYTKTAGKHNFDALAGVTIEESDTKFIRAYGAGLPENATISEELRYLDLSTQSASIAGNAGSYGILSYLGRLNYNFDNSYFATINFRADGSSKFGTNNKWGYFPSFSLGWKISQENFLENVGWMDNLMLRGGWGQLGNQSSLPNYAFANLVTPNINYAFGTDQEVYRGQIAAGMANPDLKWETSKEVNIGFDFRGFDGKVTATVDWYNRETSDMLLRVPIAAYTGIQDFPYVNGGNVTNKGFEVLVGFEDATSGGLQYGISANMARNENEVTALSNSGSAIFQDIGFSGQGSVTQVGSPIASFWGWETDGIFQTAAEVDAHAFQTSGTAPGDFRYKDLNDDGVIDADDQAIIGNPWPEIVYGANAFLNYKNFGFSVNLQGVYGNEIYNETKFRLEGASFYGYTQNAFDNRWTGPETPNATVPRMNTGDRNNNFRSSDFYLEDGSYLRIKNIQLSYKIPERVFSDLATVSVYGSVQNAYTFTKYPFLDPELGAASVDKLDGTLLIGVDNITYPVPRIFTLGVKVGL